MTLIDCAACGHSMSAEASACPSCGQPNRAALNSAMHKKQAAGVVLLLVGLGVALLVNMLVGGVIALTGLVITAANTRLV